MLLKRGKSHNSFKLLANYAWHPYEQEAGVGWGEVQHIPSPQFQQETFD